jgi:tetratricopeptide (TPR) repeat protein
MLDSKAQNLRAAIIRRLGEPKLAGEALETVLREDPLDFLALNELYLAQRESDPPSADETLRMLEAAMRRDVQAYLELATDYMGFGFWNEAREVLVRLCRDKTDAAGKYPLVYYYLGFLHERKGDARVSERFYRLASSMPADYCFPFRAESAEILRAAIERHPTDARAHYYLGNLLYEAQPNRAIEHWERSRKIDGSFAMVHRNLGWAYYRTQDNVPEAIASYEKAVACNHDDPRLFTELDELYELGNTPPEKRLALLEKHHATVIKRNDSFLREIMAMVLAGRHDEAIEFLANHHFHVREGGGEIHDVYVDAHLLRGLTRLQQGDPKKALVAFMAASEYPENLSVGRPKNDRRAPQVAYYIGRAYERLADTDQAEQSYAKAADQKNTSRWPEARFYQALALRRLGRADEARRIFDELIRTGNERLARGEATDFFAKFGEQQTRQAQQASAHYILGLGHFGKGESDAARKEFETAAKLNVSHVWASAWLQGAE